MYSVLYIALAYKSLSACACHRLRFFQLSGVEEFVEEFDDLLGAQRDDADAGADDALLDEADALFQLAAVLFEKFVGHWGVVAGTHAEQTTEGTARTLPLPHQRRIIRYNDEEILAHYVGAFGEVFDECDVFADLEFHQVVHFQREAFFEQCEVRANVQLARLYEKLHGEVQRVEEALELLDHRLLLLRALERKVDGRRHHHTAQAAVFQNNNAVAHLFDGHEVLGRLGFGGGHK